MSSGFLYTLTMANTWLSQQVLTTLTSWWVSFPDYSIPFQCHTHNGYTNYSFQRCLWKCIRCGYKSIIQTREQFKHIYRHAVCTVVSYSAHSSFLHVVLQLYKCVLSRKTDSPHLHPTHAPETSLIVTISICPSRSIHFIQCGGGVCQYSKNS